MKPILRNPAPFIITACSLALVCGLYLVGNATKERPEGEFRVDIFDKLECITYDARVRMAASVPHLETSSSQLATMFIDDTAIERVNDGAMSAFMAPGWDDGNLEGLDFSVPWPRFMYGQLIREMKAQGATAIGFDIFFSELDRKSPETAVTIDDSLTVSSDEFLAYEIGAAGNIVLATEGDLLPKPLFANVSAAIGNIASRNDYGVLRRVRAFGEYKAWHPTITNRVTSLNLKLKEARFTNDLLIIPTIAKGAQAVSGEDPQPMEIPLHPNGNLKLSKDGSNFTDDPDDLGPDDQPPFTMKRAWNLGITLAAMQLGLDLDKAEIQPDRIILTGTNGVTRTIPIDGTMSFYIDWSLRWEDIRSRKTAVVHGEPMETLIFDYGRQIRDEPTIAPKFKNRIVVIGSVATGNNLTDMGATPLEDKTPLVTKHLNVANSILSNRFVERASAAATVMWILAAGILAGVVTWRSNVVTASVRIAGIAFLYIVAAFVIYVQNRYWLPIVMPVFGGLILPHFSLVTYRVLFEQREQRHIKSVFQRMVAPDVVQELLSKAKLSLGGARREITVYFADVRGFTEFTDQAQKAAENYVKKNNLSPADAEIYFDMQAAETLETVNLYLSTIADQIKKHKGTLDKYIGDCVMAFWGAPVAQADHALCAVRAALDSQRAMHAANQLRAEKNERRKAENIAREARGEEPLAMLPLLTLGSGINTGMCTVGMMGSNEHVMSYTVFGVEVNLASRLEGVSGRGRIIISVRTFEQIKALDPVLAATCVELEPVKVKGISQAVRIFEVPWRQPEEGAALPPAEPSKTASAEPAKV